MPPGLDSLADHRRLRGVRDWLATMFRRHAPEFVQNLQSTTQQVDGAVAHYERHRERLAHLHEEARSIARELSEQLEANVKAAAAAMQQIESACDDEQERAALAKKHECEEHVEALQRQHAEQQEQLAEIELQLGQADAKLAQLRSQRDVLKARLRAAQARHTIEGGRHRTRRSRFIWPVATAGCLVGLSVVCLLLFSTRRTEVAITPQPKPGAPGPAPPARKMAEGAAQSSQTPKKTAASEEPSKLPAEPSERADEIRARRDQILKGLSEKSLDSLIQVLIASSMMPGGMGMMPTDPRMMSMDPRMMPMDPRMMPPAPGMMPSSRETQIADRFILVGKLAAVRAVDGKTWVASDPDFVDELVDYREADGSKDQGDAVSATGVVCAADAAKVRLMSGVPLVEIKQIQREGDPQSRAVVGQKRDSSTLRADAAADTLRVVLRKKATPGTVVKFVGEFTSYQASSHSVLVNPKVSRHSRAEILFPASDPSMFADYRSRDLVDVTAALGEQPDQPGAALKLTGKTIVRKANPRSLVTDQGREIPVSESSAEKGPRQQARTAADVPGRVITQKESDSINAAKQSDRRPQNGDFRDGLAGWSAEDAGDAFVVFPQGDQTMITSYGSKQEASQGRIYQCFTVPDAPAELTFFVHGGQDPQALYVALWAGERLIYRVTGKNDNEPFEVRWGLSGLKGQTLTLEIRDAKDGPWGFIGVHGFEVLENQKGK